jgi:hypothetical protein
MGVMAGTISFETELLEVVGTDGAKFLLQIGNHHYLPLHFVVTKAPIILTSTSISIADSAIL